MRLLRRKNKYFSIREELRRLNKLIEKATIDVDVALVEELMEEKYRLLSSI